MVEQWLPALGQTYLVVAVAVFVTGCLTTGYLARSAGERLNTETIYYAMVIPLVLALLWPVVVVALVVMSPVLVGVAVAVLVDFIARKWEKARSKRLSN